ncbi:hypothetical protein Thimo_2764 [Thioflavicoccus mobilis 8321]|uniref:Uncharacterized protein n=1 Tax=Thioflavicoccus mobilis 8321 TaxID=765912 RepID=L0H1N1_9GAMM|nr:hypothetical protein Thimo_2764 [Thioflavicoccus mobilis 8321]
MPLGIVQATDDAGPTLPLATDDYAMTSASRQHKFDRCEQVAIADSAQRIGPVVRGVTPQRKTGQSP